MLSLGQSYNRSFSRSSWHPNPAAFFDQLSVKVSVTLWVNAENPVPALPVTVNE
jgi:hypothetical protein